MDIDKLAVLEKACTFAGAVRRHVDKMIDDQVRMSTPVLRYLAPYISEWQELLALTDDHWIRELTKQRDAIRAHEHANAETIRSNAQRLLDRADEREKPLRLEIEALKAKVARLEVEEQQAERDKAEWSPIVYRRWMSHDFFVDVRDVTDPGSDTSWEWYIVSSSSNRFHSTGVADTRKGAMKGAMRAWARLIGMPADDA